MKRGLLGVENEWMLEATDTRERTHRGSEEKI